MKKIKTTLENVGKDIKDFYKEKEWHFLTLNGVVLDDELTEIQWIFSKYGENDNIVLFFTEVKQDEVVPSITDIIPSAIMSQREIVDMFGIEVEDSEKGLYLDEDSMQQPLSACSMKG